MIKKFIMLLTAFTLVFAPMSFVAVDDAFAKGYKSGKKSFSPAQNDSNVQKSDTNTNASKTTVDSKTSQTKNTAAKSSGGGMMKGLLLGGLGGLLLGSMFAGLGSLGPILAFLFNILTVMAVVMLIVKAFRYFKKQRERKAEEAWKR
jgi:predicted lipid-binding transport protein (Tim44 family)